MIDTKSPTISIFMLVYNHEQYISQAIESIIMQQVNYTYEIVIGEDCSTDKSREIVLDYKRKYPKIIKLLLHEKNIGAMANQMAVLKSCSGKYIAMCEGDDYWTDPYKLQKQVDFLEANNGFALCFHKVMIYRESNLLNDFMQEPDEVSTIYDLAKGLYIRTLSVVFRKSIFDNLPEKAKDTISGDYALFLLLSEYGKLKCFDDIMGVYRIHDGGVWSKINDVKRKSGSIERLLQLHTYFVHNVEVQTILFQNIKRNLFDLFDNLVNSNNVEQYITLIDNLLSIQPHLVVKLIFAYSQYKNTNLIDIKKSYRYKLADALLKPVSFFKSLKK